MKWRCFEFYAVLGSSVYLAAKKQACCTNGREGFLELLLHSEVHAAQLQRQVGKQEQL